MKPLLLAVSGLPFSGKSTLAKKLSKALDLPVVNYDDDIYAKHKHEVPKGTSAAKEFDMIEAIAREYLAERLRAGQSFIYDDLGLQWEDREHVRVVTEACGGQYLLVFVDTPVEVIDERREANRKTKGREDIGDAKLQLDVSLLEKPQAEEAAIVVTPATSIDGLIEQIRTQL